MRDLRGIAGPLRLAAPRAAERRSRRQARASLDMRLSGVSRRRGSALEGSDEMSLPYLPLYVGDYEADTAHLSIYEDGAYMRLLRLIWRSPGCSIPDDEAWIFRRMRAQSDDDQAAIRTVIDEFMERKGGRISSPRLMREFKKADETSRKRSAAGKRGGRPKTIENKEKEQKPGFEFDKAGPKHPEPEPEPYIGSGDSARARDPDPPKDDLEALTDQVIAAAGVDISKQTRPYWHSGQAVTEVRSWVIDLGLSHDEILGQVSAVMKGKRDGPPVSLTYFRGAMQRLAGEKNKPPLRAIDGGTHGRRPDHDTELRGIIAAAARGSTG